MIPVKPLAALPTHEVTNMPPHLENQDLGQGDIALRESVHREGGGWAETNLAELGVGWTATYGYNGSVLPYSA